MNEFIPPRNKFQTAHVKTETAQWAVTGNLPGQKSW